MMMLRSKSPPEEGWRQRLAADVSAASVLIRSDSSAKCRVPLQRWREVGVRRFDLGGVTASRGLCLAAVLALQRSCLNMSHIGFVS